MNEIEGIENWLSQRSQLKQAVTFAVGKVNKRFMLKGSFQHGNFHLLQEGSRSFSDVDLVLQSDGRNRHAWEAEVGALLTNLGWHLRVSVQHFDSIKDIRSSDSQLLAFAELVRFFPLTNEPAFASYLFAKTTLTILGHQEKLKVADTAMSYSVDNPLADGPEWLRNSTIMHARNARLGLAAPFEAQHARTLLDALSDSNPVVAHHLTLMETADRQSAKEWLFPQLEASNVSAWLQTRLKVLIQENIP